MLRYPGFRLTAILGLAVIAIFTGQVYAASQAEQLRLLADAYEAGELDREQYYMYQLQTIFEPEKLPPQFTLDVTEPAKCATPILLDIRRQWDTFSEEFQSRALILAVRPNTEFHYVSPDGYFRLHYDTLDGMESPPVPTEDLDSNHIPDFVQDIANYADSAWRQIVLNFGYQRPPSDGTLGGDSRYDIYFDQFTYYGVTNGDFAADSAWDDWASHIVLHRSFEGFQPNQDPEGDRKGSMKVAIAHELFHAVQYYYDAYLDTWWAEQTAVWMEDEVQPQVHDNYNYFDHFWTQPELSILDVTDLLRPYALFVWPEFLTQFVDYDIVKDVIEAMAAPSSSLMSELQSELLQKGSSLSEAFKNFQYWNYITGTRDDGAHYVDGADYPEIEIMRSHDALPVYDLWSLAAPYNLGSNYIEVLNDSAYIGILTFTLDTAFAAPWGLAYMTRDPLGNYEFYQATVSAFGQAKVYIPYFENYESAVFIPYVKGTSIGGPYGVSYSLFFRPMGDADDSGSVDIDDVVWIIDYIFGGGPPSNPVAAMDADCSTEVDIDDVVYLIAYIFSGGPPPCGEGQ